MQGSKIRLSNAEIELFSNAEIILTKNSIIKKTVMLLAELQETLTNEKEIGNYTFSSTPKISKGENYLGLPYVVLDFPRISEGPNLFFIRSFFWWGNFFSSTLQLSGSYKEEYRPRLESAYELLAERGYFIGVNEDPWVHHFGEENFKKISSLAKPAFAAVLHHQTYIKIAARWPLSDWDLAINNLKESWKLMMGLIS